MTLRQRNGITILQLTGELTTQAQVIELKQQLMQLSHTAHGAFVLDLSAVTAINVRILGVLVFIQQLAKQHHNELRLLKPSPVVLHLLESIRLQHTLIIYNDEVAATTF